MEAEHNGTSDLLQPYVSMQTMPARSTSAYAGGCFGLAFTRQVSYRISCQCTSEHFLQHTIVAAFATRTIRPVVMILQTSALLIRMPHMMGSLLLCQSIAL